MNEPHPIIGQSFFDPRTTDALVGMLNQSLLDTRDLACLTNQARSKTKGQNVYALHLLFDQLHAQLLGFGDEFAGRAITLGGPGWATNPAGDSTSWLNEPAGKAQADRIHLDALVDRYGEYTGWMRQAIRQASRLHDHDTAHLYTTVSQAIDKALWRLTAHQEA